MTLNMQDTNPAVFQLLTPKSDSLTAVNLGDKIIKSNQFTINVPNNGAFYGIRHMDIIKNVVFIISNFRQRFKINGFLDNDVWRLSNFLIPLSKLLEYSDDINLEVEIEINGNKKNKFYTFNAIFDKSITPAEQRTVNNVMYLKLPTVYDHTYIEFIGNIWRVVQESKI